jgi:DNA-binding phage protein
LERAIPFIKKEQKSNIAPINGTIKEEVNIVSEPKVASNEVIKMTFFSKVEAWFKKVFTNFPGWATVASSTLNYVAPLLETVLALTAGTPVEAEVATIISKIQADLGVAAVAVENAVTSTSLTNALASIESNLPTLLTTVQVTDPTTVTKVTAVVTEILDEVKAVIAAIPAVVTAPTVTE